MVDFFRPIDLNPSPPTGVSPLVSQILGVLSQGQALARQTEEDRRRRVREDFAQRLQEASLRRQAAANTPLAEAPTEVVGDQNAAAAGQTMSGSAPLFGAEGLPKPDVGPITAPVRKLPPLKGTDGSIIPQAPLDYEEEAHQKQIEDIQRARVAGGQDIMVTPEMSAAFGASPDSNAALVKILYPEGSMIDKSIAAKLIQPEGNEFKTWTDDMGHVHAGTFNKNQPPGKNFTPYAPETQQGDNTKLHGDEYLATLPPEYAPLVKAAGNYDMDVAKIPGRGPARQRLFENALQYNPNFREQDYPIRAALKTSFTVGKDADVMKSINTVIHHLDKFSNSATNLDNYNLHAINTVKNWVKNQAGNPATSNFEKDRTAVADELSTVFKNTGATDEQVKAWRDSFTSSQSPSQLADGIDEALNLLDGRLKSQEFKYEQGMQSPLEKSHFQIYSPESQRILGGLHDRASALRGLKVPGGGTGPGAPTPGGVPQVRTKNEYDALPDHAQYLDVATGKTFCKNGCLPMGKPAAPAPEPTPSPSN